MTDKLKINHNLPPPKQTPYEMKGMVPVIYPQDVANWIVHEQKPTTHSQKNPNFNYDRFQGDYATPKDYKAMQKYWKTEWPKVRAQKIEQMRKNNTLQINAATRDYIPKRKEPLW